jgi:hypothetical protein
MVHLFGTVVIKVCWVKLILGHHTHHPLQVMGSTGPLTNNSNSGGHVTTTSAIVNEVSTDISERTGMTSPTPPNYEEATTEHQVMISNL